MTIDPERLEQLKKMSYDEYLLTPEWQLRREQALKRTKYRCMVCYAPDNLNVHHRTYERRGDELESDLTVLCESCHALYHRAGKLAEAEVLLLPLVNVATEYLFYLDKLHDSKDKIELPFGYRDLDTLTGGLQRSHLSVLAGISQTGKKAFALHTALSLASRNKQILYISLSQSAKQVMTRLIAMRGNICIMELLNGQIKNEGWESIVYALDDFNTDVLSIVDTATLTLSTLRTTIDQHIANAGSVDCVIIDNYALLTPEQNWGNQVQQAKLLTRGLKLVARTYNIPILVLCTLSQIKAPNHIPTIEDLQQLCMPELIDDILILHRDDLFDPESLRMNIVDIIVVKGSSLGEVSLYLAKDYGHLTELDILKEGTKE